MTPAPSGCAPSRPSDRLRVCHLSMTLKTGGLERLLVDFARFHDATRFDLRFIALDELGPPADDLRQAGYDVATLDLNRVGKRACLRNLRDLLHDEQIDVLHTHNTYPHFYGTLAARWAGTAAVVNTQHGRGCGPGWKSRWQFRIANRLAKSVVGVSEDATALCRAQDSANAARMRCIWNGIDINRFGYHGPKEDLVAISVGRLSVEKDFPTLLRAVNLVARVHPGFRLLLVGDGAERPRLERLRESLGIEANVELLGERSDIPELLSQAGFFVCSSKTEGISLTLLEAMAVGLPIVATRVGGNPEIVVDGLTGKLVPALNPDALAAAMLQMIDSRGRWPAMGRTARLRAETHFSIERMVRQYEDLYQECGGRSAV